MPAFRFEALDASGKTINGLVEADNPKAARAQLRTQHMVPLNVAAVQVAEAEGSSPKLFARRVFNSSALSVWTRQLSGLVVAGLPLERALTALADEAEDPRQRELVAHLRAEVNAGSPFARALTGFPREFDDVWTCASRPCPRPMANAPCCGSWTRATPTSSPSNRWA